MLVSCHWVGSLSRVKPPVFCRSVPMGSGGYGCAVEVDLGFELDQLAVQAGGQLAVTAILPMD